MASDRWTRITAAAALLTVAACSPRPEPRPSPAAPLLGTAGAASTSREDLGRTVDEARAALARDAFDGRAAVALADALLRQTRVTGNAGLAATAEQALVRVLSKDAESYEARRLLAAVYLSQHRFEDALREAQRCLAVNNQDVWAMGVLGDAHLEMGHYAEAFGAYDRMNARKPNAASYARASYARELQGDLDAALRFMDMAATATSARDPESLAWHRSQLGHLYVEMGRWTDARREYAHADFVFPGHPFASDGLARVAAATGDEVGALRIVQARLEQNPMPADFALAGDLLASLGRTAEAERHYRIAETSWRADVPEPTRLARFLTERGRRLDEALQLARTTWATRKDIFTADALAWAAYRIGDLPLAQTMIAEAVRTGTADRTIRYHQAVIAHRSGQPGLSRTLISRALQGSPRFDPVAGPAARRFKRELEGRGGPTP